MKQAIIICMNDSIEAVVIDDIEYANKVKEKRATDYFNKNAHVYKSIRDYQNQCYWHLHILNIEIKELKDGNAKKAKI